MKILLVGSGGREHALAWKMAQSPLCEALWAAPGNPGIEQVGHCVDLSVDDSDGIIAFAKEQGDSFYGREARKLLEKHGK